jgi:hypothetical protein
MSGDPRPHRWFDWREGHFDASTTWDGHIGHAVSAEERCAPIISGLRRSPSALA